MGELNRQASPFNLDVYDLSNVGAGVSYFKGEVAFGTFGTLSALIGLTENLRVKNADKILLTDFNDTLVASEFGNIIHTGKVRTRSGLAPTASRSTTFPRTTG